jgi:multiple sugar transport system substrate-binding protein
LQASEDYRTPPLIAEWLPMSNVLYPILQQIILGDTEPQAGLDQAAEEVRQLMLTSGYYG